MPPLPAFRAAFGVDFSGAKQAGKTIWVARVEPRARGKFALTLLDRLD